MAEHSIIVLFAIYLFSALSFSGIHIFFRLWIIISSLFDKVHKSTLSSLQLWKNFILSVFIIIYRKENRKNTKFAFYYTKVFYFTALENRKKYILNFNISLQMGDREIDKSRKLSWYHVKIILQSYIVSMD